MATRKTIATYSYFSSEGNLVFVKLRYEPKDFEYRTPDGRISRVLPRKILYRLPELLTASLEQTVFVTEGEKDADRLCSLGLVATCNPDGGGKGKWSPAYRQHFRGRHVVILADNDWTGAEHAYDVGRRLHRVAASVKVLSLPNVPHKGDVSDYLDTGGTVEALLQLADAGTLWQQRLDVELKPRGRGSREFNAGWIVGRAFRATATAQEKLVLIALECLRRPTQANVGAAVGLSLRRVKSILAALRAKGAIQGVKLGREVVSCSHIGAAHDT